MASTALQAAASFSTARIQRPTLISDCHPSCSSSTFRGRPLSIGLLKGGCGGLRSGRKSSVRSPGGHCLVVRGSTAIVGPLSEDAIVAVPDESETEKTPQVEEELLSCPVCFKPLFRTGIPGLKQQAISRSGFKCLTCQKAYSSRSDFLDLTITAEAKVYSETQSSGTELFRSPFVSFVYERGWRQNFQNFGFPGPDEEVKLAQGFLKPAYGGVLLDVSCGSGLFTRRFANLDLFSAVIATDFSENMLRQTLEYIKEDDSLVKKTIGLVRADASRMPFATGSIDAVHAGAALHCWPSPAAGMAEISRILRPGGVFVGTTFLLAPVFANFYGSGLMAVNRSARMRYFEEAELKELMQIAGLVNYQFVKRGTSFIMVSAQKKE